MDKMAVVTGAAKGIGLCIVKKLLNEGYHVLMIDIDEIEGLRIEEIFTRENHKVKFLNCDVSEEKDVMKAVSYLKENGAVCDVLVNNAAIQYISNFEEISYETWRKVIDVNLNGTFLMTKYMLPFLRKSVQGNVINMTSLYTDRARLNKYHYDASKAGVSILTKEMALEFSKYNIRVNGIAPGAMDTPMNAESFSDEESVKKVIEGVPLKRLGQGEDVAKTVMFLISDQASYITGEIIKVDGGRGL
ncbi:MAG: SDR family oxidoreductase [Clostridia bacterium]|nr:SDR family oxidoreductase [Clostridia bacterium]